MKSWVMLFVFVFILSLILIKQIGIIGGGWALLAGEGIGLIINTIFIEKILLSKDNSPVKKVFGH